MLIRFGRLASLTGSRIVRIPFWKSVLILLGSIGLGKVIVRSKEPEMIPARASYVPAGGGPFCPAAASVVLRTAAPFVAGFAVAFVADPASGPGAGPDARSDDCSARESSRCFDPP